MDFNLLEALAKAAVFFPPFLFALCFHEYAHGWVARRKGDMTAELMGRLTLNPIPHMDFLGTLLLPAIGIFGGGIMFGWAKPVPVNPRNLKNPKDDMFWIALAGPLSNILLGFIGGYIMVLLTAFFPQGSIYSALINMLEFFLIINAMLAVFNMIPLHPLDGGKVLARFLPYEWNRKLEEIQSYSTFILLGFLFLGGFKILAIPIYFLKALFFNTAVWTLSPFL